MALTGNSIDDYRNKQQSETQYATYLPDMLRLAKFASIFRNDQELFYTLEAMDINRPHLGIPPKLLSSNSICHERFREILDLDQLCQCARASILFFCED